ncbi:MAG: YciI family protein [Saprospiraceae bacterium]
MRILIIFIMFFGLSCQCVLAQNLKFQQGLADSLGADQFGMKSYIFVILKTGHDTITDKKRRSELFRGHMQNIKRLADEGKLIVAGPFGKNEREYRGLFILDVKTIEEATKLVQTDPAVQAGIFDMDLIEWYGSAALPMYLKYNDMISKENP